MQSGEEVPGGAHQQLRRTGMTLESAAPAYRVAASTSKELDRDYRSIWMSGDHLRQCHYREEFLHGRGTLRVMHLAWTFKMDILCRTWFRISFR